MPFAASGAEKGGVWCCTLVARRHFRGFEGPSVLAQILPVSWDFCRERATRIELAFSAWEASEWHFRDQDHFEKAQMTLDIGRRCYAAIMPHSSFCVARKAAELGCCTVLHDDAASTQPVRLRACDDEGPVAPSDPAHTKGFPFCPIPRGSQVRRPPTASVGNQRPVNWLRRFGRVDASLIRESTAVPTTLRE